MSILLNSCFTICERLEKYYFNSHVHVMKILLVQTGHFWDQARCPDYRSSHIGVSLLDGHNHNKGSILEGLVAKGILRSAC